MKLLKKIFNYFDIRECHKNYQKKLQELRCKKGKVKVLFLVRENQKWSYQSVYEEMQNSDIFEPTVVVSLLWMSHIGKDKTRNNLEENYRFFKDRNINVEYAYKNGQYIDLRDFGPDIVFYDQSWDLPEIHEPKEVSKFALTCYSNYSLPVFNYLKDYTNIFHAKLFINFIDSKFNLERYSNYSKEAQKNCKVTGYSKLDEYLKNEEIVLNKIWKNPEKIKIIYAPHHSFNDKCFNCSTFDKNGKEILEFAQKHTETTWIFKPHPRFKYAMLKNNIMTEEEIKKYYKTWQDVGIVYEEGNYFDIFRTSDLMITDCCSFLGEYLPANKPLIRLINKKSLKLNKLGESISDSYYQCDNIKDLEKFYDEIIVQKNDYKKELREKSVKNVFDNNLSSQKIMKILLEDLNLQDGVR